MERILTNLKDGYSRAQGRVNQSTGGAKRNMVLDPKNVLHVLSGQMNQCMEASVSQPAETDLHPNYIIIGLDFVIVSTFSPYSTFVTFQPT